MRDVVEVGARESGVAEVLVAARAELPDVGRSSRTADLVASLVFLGLFAAFIVVQQFGLPWVAVLEGVPLLNPELWSFWLPYFLVLIVLEMLFAVGIYMWGWNWWLASANVALNIAFTVPAVWLLTTGQLISADALDAIGWPWDVDSEWVVTAIIVVVVVGVAIWDVVDGVIKTLRGRGGSTLTLGRI